MLGKRRVGWVLRLVVADGLALLVSFVIAYGCRALLDEPLGRAVGPLEHYLWLVALIVPVWLALLAALDAYGVRWTVHSRAWLVARVCVMGFVVLTAGLFLFKESEINRSMLALFAVVSALGLWVERGVVAAWLRRAGHGARWARVALVVGGGERAKRVLTALRQYPEAGWVIRGCVSLDASDSERAVQDVPVLGSRAELQEILQSEGVVDEVFFAVPPERLDEITDALEVCESFGVDTRVLVDLYRPAQAHPFVEELFALPFYGFSPTLNRQSVLAAKRVLDLVGAAVVLTATLPLLVGIAVLVKLTSPGPVFFRQERAGFHGRRFRMYKFRTMVEGAEHIRDRVAHLNEMTGPVFKVADDPRLTAVGRFLRRRSLDELPQLLNVLTGEMSLVGPRPLPVYEASQIKGAQRRRLAMRPGITGAWQVAGRNAVDFDEWMRMDLLYVDQWSLALDLKILLRTIPVVLSGRRRVLIPRGGMPIPPIAPERPPGVGEPTDQPPAPVEGRASGSRPLVVAGLAAMALGVPLAVLPNAAGPYDDPKAWALPILAAATGLAWLAGARREPIEARGGADGRARALRFIVLAYLAWTAITTVTSIAPALSVLGSFGRGMGLVTVATAVFVFVVIQAECRTAPAVRSLVDVVLLGSVPVCLLALAQAAGWDPFPPPWDPAVRRLTVRSTFGTHIFLGSYLVVLVPLAAARLEWACRERLESGRWPATRRAEWVHAALGAAWVMGAVGLVALASHWSVVWWALVPWGIAGATIWAWHLDRVEAGVDSAFTASLLAALVVAQVLVVVFSRGRGAFLGMLAGLSVAGFALLVRRRAWKMLAAAALAFAALALFLVLLNRPGSLLAPLRATPLLSRLARITDVQPGSPGWVRLKVWKAISDGWTRQVRGHAVIPGRSPLARSLIGYGPETQLLVLDPLTSSFRANFRGGGEGWHAQYAFDRAHNVPLDHLVTEGLVGVGLWALLAAGLFVVGVGRLRTSPPGGETTIRIGALGAVLGHLVDDQVGIATAMPLVLFWIAAALLTSPPWRDRLVASRVAPGPLEATPRWWVAALLVAALATALVAWSGTRWLLASVAFAQGTRAAIAGRLEDAHREFRRSTALVPWLALPAESLAYASLRLSAREADVARRLPLLHEAEAALSQARRHAMAGAGSWGLAGQIAFARARAGEPNQLEVSREAFATALRLNPGDPRLLAQWALTWLESGDVLQARRAAEQALARDPFEWIAWVVLARALRTLGDRPGEQFATERARSLGPADVDRLLGAGR